ncbi:MAG TPA: class I SAM-dependent methyltransferase [Bryobacteraceae bacterium]|jgi:2-polyprenyl-3-methyl-5-hydroxy-6-metoxy-1,4-benzoquinol methylase|nr:class I SAM-dependent methyltransferase [Bryobacteraceae bacterium]
MLNHCPACEGGEFELLFTASDRLYNTTSKSFRVVECTRCRLMQLRPQPAPAELENYYPKNYWFSPEESAASRLEEAYRRIVLRDHVRFVERALKESGESGPVLDVGCGGGLFLRLLQDRGFRVMGLDFSLQAARLAWSRNHAAATCASLDRAPFRSESCAAITMFHVLEHLYEPSSYLRAAHDLLQPKGRLIIQVPNAACWQFLILGASWNGVDVPRHLYDFRPADLDRMLDSCGFETVRRKYFSLRDNPAGLATSLAPALDPMARRIRQPSEAPRARLAKDLLYLALVAAAAPFTLLEAACRAGSTIMIEARKKA